MITVTATLQQKKNIYYAVLYYKVNLIIYSESGFLLN